MQHCLPGALQGVIVVPASDRFEAQSLLLDRQVPFVVADRIPLNFRGDTVTIDNIDAGRLAAEHLIELGHRNVIVVVSTLSLLNIRERCEGINQVFHARDLLPPKVIEAGQGFEQAVAEISGFLDGSSRPTAFLALTTFATLGILASLQRKGLHVPSDISVMGFDDYSWMAAVSPPLTSIRQPVGRIGDQAWKLLHSRIEGSTEPAQQIRLLCERMERASTTAPTAMAVRPATPCD